MDLFFQIIEQQANQMSSLITDLLDMARIGTGTLPVSPGPVDPAVLVDQARNNFLTGGGVNVVHIDFAPGLPLVMADRRRVVQVLGNLLSNSARHSPESSPIHMAVSWEEVHVQFSVTDHGNGLSPGILLQLFKKFTRMDGDDNGQNLGGSGMGLAICKGIVEAHGGRIWAESEGAGLGAWFTFTLPVAAESGSRTMSGSQRTAGRSRPGEPDRTRVLVVDDDPQTLRYVRDSLSDAGYDSVVTGDPEQMASQMEEEKPHLVLLDMMLPRTDGIALMENVPELGEVPVIFLSAYGRDQIIARALQAGAADYVVKPFSPTELVARIQTALRRRNSPRLGRASGALGAGRPDRQLLRAQGLRGRPGDPTHRHRVPAAVRALGQRRPGAHPRAAPAAGLGSGAYRPLRPGAHCRQEPSPQAGRRRRQPQVHHNPAASRIPHAEG